MNIDLYYIFKLIFFCSFLICISFIGFFFVNNIIHVFIFIELILTAFIIIILSLAKIFDDINGIIMSLFLLGLIASEAALGLIIIISLKKFEFKIY